MRYVLLSSYCFVLFLEDQNRSGKMPIVGFRGSWTALITPFKEDFSIDFDGLRKNISFQINQGIKGVLAVGTTGESPTLSTNEHNEVIAKARTLAADGCDILAGTGSNSTAEAVAHTKHALKAGVDKVLLVDCYYNGPSSLELRREYYEAVLEDVPDAKIVVYVIPGRSGTAISPADIAIMSGSHDRVIAIKEATGDLNRMEEERTLMPDMSIMSGDDDITFAMMNNQKIGAAGVISVTTNIAPRTVTGMITAALGGDMDGARAAEQKLKPLFSMVTVKAESERILPDGRRVTVQDRFRNPIAVKAAMNVLGMPAGPCRRPLGKLTAAGADVIRGTLNKVHRESPEILSPIGDFYGVDIEKRLQDDTLWQSLLYPD
jgi:4-hydroxy-tetrahydrodipicolinate synthase